MKHFSKVVFLDTSAAIIASIRSVLPAFFTMLDEWHLNQRQYNDVIIYSRLERGSARFCKIEREINLLWRSPSIVQYRVRRTQFEQSWHAASIDLLNQLLVRIPHGIDVERTEEEERASLAITDEYNILDNELSSSLYEKGDDVLKNQGKDFFG